MDLSVVTVSPSLSVVGSWEEVLLFSMYITVSQNFLELELQDANFCLKKVAFAFLTKKLNVLVPDFPENVHIAGTI